jgi:hypothetical protein
MKMANKTTERPLGYLLVYREEDGSVEVKSYPSLRALNTYANDAIAELSLNPEDGDIAAYKFTYPFTYIQLTQVKGPFADDTTENEND